MSNGSLFHFFPTNESLVAALYLQTIAEYQAAGVGLAFALACDLVVLSERARLVLAFVRGEALDGDAAVRFGLANEVVPAGDVLARARAWAILDRGHK